MYLGNQPALSYTSFAKQDFTTSATTSYTLDYPVANENELALFINFVRQEPGSYSASGTSLTLTSATSASDDMYAIFLGKAVQTVNPPSGSVGTSQLGSSLDFSSKTITLASNMKNTPAFLVRNSASQSLSDDTVTKVQFNSVVYDTESGAYDNVTNYRFTVPSGQGGKYAVYSKIIIDSEVSSNLDGAVIDIRKNNSSITGGGGNEAIFLSNPVRLTPLSQFAAVQLNAGDYLEVFCRIEATDATGGRVNTNGNFGAYKIIE